MKHKGKLFTLLATGLLSLGIALSGCAKEPTPGPGPSPSPSPNPSPEPSPGPVEPEVNYVYDNLDNPNISGLSSNPIDINENVVFYFDKVDNKAVSGYDVRLDKADVEEENAQRVDPANITEENGKYKVEVKVSEEGNYKVYVKVLAKSEDEQKSPEDVGTKTIYKDAENFNSAEFTTVDLQKSEFMEFYNQIYTTVGPIVNNANAGASIDKIYAFNVTEDNKLELFLNVKRNNGTYQIQSYEYLLPQAYNKNQYKDLTNAVKLMAIDSNFNMGFITQHDNIGNSFDIDCWDKLSTTNLLGEETILKQGLKDPSFEKVFAITNSRKIDFNDVHFNINGIYKIKENDTDIYYYFDERITQPLGLQSDGFKVYTNFLEDKNNCKITEVEGRELSPLNADFQAKYDKYVVNKVANRMSAREVAQKPVYTVKEIAKEKDIEEIVSRAYDKYKKKEAQKQVAKEETLEA